MSQHRNRQFWNSCGMSRYVLQHECAAVHKVSSLKISELGVEELN